MRLDSTSSATSGACSCGAMMGFTLALALYTLAGGQWLLYFAGADKPRYGSGIWDISFVSARFNDSADFVITDCTVEENCVVVPGRIFWDDTPPEFCNVSEPVYQYWSGPNGFCKGSQFEVPPQILGVRAFTIILAIATIPGTVLGCVGSNSTRVNFAALSAAVVVVFSMASYGTYLGWEYVQGLRTLQTDAYLPFKTTQGTYIPLRVQLYAGPGVIVNISITIFAAMAAIAFLKFACELDRLKAEEKHYRESLIMEIDAERKLKGSSPAATAANAAAAAAGGEEEQQNNRSAPPSSSSSTPMSSSAAAAPAPAPAPDHTLGAQQGSARKASRKDELAAA